MASRASRIIGRYIAESIHVCSLRDRTSIGPPRERLYGTYASQHAPWSDGEAAALIYRHDIRPMLLAPTAGPMLDIGYGQGQLVRLMLLDGYDATGIDVSQEQVTIAQVACQARIQQGDYRALLDARAGEFAAVTATDVLEHLSKAEVLDTFDRVARAHSRRHLRGAGAERSSDALTPIKDVLYPMLAVWVLMRWYRLRLTAVGRLPATVQTHRTPGSHHRHSVQQLRGPNGG